MTILYFVHGVKELERRFGVEKTSQRRSILTPAARLILLRRRDKGGHGIC